MLDFIYEIYLRIKGQSLAAGISRLLLKKILKASLPIRYKFSLSWISNAKKSDDFIVSMTSYPGRINLLWQTIESIQQQSIKPSRIILWLAENQFPNREKNLPERILKYKKYGLDIRFCDDLKSHKKYFYAFQEFRNEVIVTVDDDVFYPKHMIRCLFINYKKYPNAISANRIRVMNFASGNLQSYDSWNVNKPDTTEPSYMNVAIGVGGVLYPPGSIDGEVFNRGSIHDLCLNADDLWLKIMSLRNRTKVSYTNIYRADFITIPKSQNEALYFGNVIDNGNNNQIQSILNYYNMRLEDYISDLDTN